MESAIFKHPFIAIAISKNMFACAGKISFGELACILTTFREDIDAEAVLAVTLYAITRGYIWKNQHQKTEELAEFFHGISNHVFNNALESVFRASARARLLINTFLLRPCLPLFIETADFGTPKRSAKK